MASAEANLMVELRYSEEGMRECERELQALSEIKKTEARKRVSLVVDHGSLRLNARGSSPR